MLPEFNSDGNLPEGLHRTTEKELFERFATGSARRQWLGERLRDLLDFAKSTGELSRLFLWGSFVTSKEIPHDLDVLLVMSTDVDIDALPARYHCCLTTSKRGFASTPIYSGAKSPSVNRCCTYCWTRTRQARTSNAKELSR